VFDRFPILSRLRNAFNLFLDRNLSEEFKAVLGRSSSRPAHRKILNYGNDRSIVNAIYNRIAIDVSTVKLRHIRTDKNDNFEETINSGLNSCLSLEANLDQTSRDFIRDIIMSLCDEGVVALVPIDTSVSLISNNSFDILSMRTARIVQWYPHHVRVLVYNDNSGEKEEITLEKSKVCIIENPLYSTMNERNSILQRLIRKLNLLDVIDEQSGSGKLDIIIQLPYTLKSGARKKQAEERRAEMEEQLSNSKYGVAYSEATEKVIQLNRPAENNLMNQIEYLTRMVYAQLGISEAILSGTADEKELLNYWNRTVEPMTSAITNEMTRKFLTKTARSQGQTIGYFRNLFSIVTPERLADLADKLTRNEIASPNDLRAVMGWLPSKAQGADELRNRNISQPSDNPIDVTSEFDKVTAKKGE
jgi:hypothetical protein